jgi:hypothetical protein
MELPQKCAKSAEAPAPFTVLSGVAPLLEWAAICVARGFATLDFVSLAPFRGDSG